MLRIEVCLFDDLREGDLVCVRAAGRELGVVRWGDRAYALLNFCPHQGGPLCRGQVVPKMVSESVGLLAQDTDTAVVICPWHGWEYRVDTGEALWDATYKAKTYETEVADGRVYVVVKATRN